MTGFVGVRGICGRLAGDPWFFRRSWMLLSRERVSSAPKHERPLHVHRHGDELRWQALRANPNSDAAHPAPALHRGEGALHG